MMQVIARRRQDFFLRSLASSVGSRAGSSGVREPVISLSHEEITRSGDDEMSSSPPRSRPLSYYLDTHSVVLQLQHDGRLGGIAGHSVTLFLTAGYSLQQAEGLVKLLSHAFERAVTPLERSVLSQRDLVRVKW